MSAGGGTRVDVQRLDQETWQRCCTPFADQSLMQQWAFGRAREESGRGRAVHHVVRADGRVAAVAQAIAFALPLLGTRLVWINRGPLWRSRGGDGRGEDLAVALRSLHEHWVVRRRALLRIAPPLADTPENDALVRACGFQRVPEARWSSARVDLTADVAALRAGLKQKWRNGLNKAERSGLRLEVGTSDALTTTLLSDHRRLLREKGYATRVPPELVERIQRHLPPDRRMVVLSADHESGHLGSILVGGYARTAEYLVGAVGAAGKRLNAGQFLLWHALVAMKARGYLRFDVGGVHPRDTPAGIRRFKEGLGGHPYRLVGTYEAARSATGRLLRRVLARVPRA